MSTSAAEQIIERLQAFRANRTRLAHDIEGFPLTGVSVCSFAWSANEALSVPLAHLDWRRWWEPDDEARVLDALRGVLEDPLVPKIAHNWSYELFTWRWKYGIQVRGVCDDTMLKHAAIYPELEKALDVVATIYAKEPYWKDMGDTEDDEQLARYNALDSMVTFEVNDAMDRDMTEAQRGYYQHQLALLEPCGEMMYSGLCYDAPARDAMVAQIQAEVYEAQGALDQLAGIAPPTFREVVEAVAFKKAWDKCSTWESILEHAKPTMRAQL
jgi:DNA polymerase I-like protein with 3'-5' exonuclease and polymerase domains